MGKSKWRIADHVQVSRQRAIVFFSLVLFFSTLSFQMLAKSTWGDSFSTLLTGVSTCVATSLKDSTSTATLQNDTTPRPGDSPQIRFEESHNYHSLHSHHSHHSHRSYRSYHSYHSYHSSQSSKVASSSHDVELLVPKNIDSSSVTEISAGSSLPRVIENVVPPSSSGRDNFSLRTPGYSTTTSEATAVSADTGEKFLVPILSWQVGAGNQFMEYLSAAVIARSLNRTLCLSPFFPGPSRHTGRVTSGFAWEDRYEVSSLSRFTRVATLQRCLKQCDYNLDEKWMLKSSREPIMQKWKKYPENNESLNLNWNYVKWSTPEDVFATLGHRGARCVGMLGLFPGLRWRGAFLAISAFIQPAPRINKVADMLQEYALGKGTRYLAVHWRFEESECGGHHVGLCFVRCDDGSVINSGLRSEAKEWQKAGETQCSGHGHVRGVTVDKKDIQDAIQERAFNHNVKTLYLATDGWMRGERSVALLKEVVASLRKRGLTVVGLWKLPGLPNFTDGKYFDPVTTLGKANQDLNGAQIALVDQELCSRADSFMGSGQSTFSLSVFRVRLARRKVKQIMEAVEVEGSANVQDSKVVDKLIAETLLKDNHPAGLHCRYLQYMKRANVTETVETSAEEYPDGWLDLEACEGRIGHGGRCQLAKCF